MRKNIVIAVLLIVPFAIAGGELVWQTFLMDLLGMRDVSDCVYRVLERELKPQVEESLTAVWDQRARAETDSEIDSIWVHTEELTGAMQVEFYTDEYVDHFAEQTARTTSCKDLERAHWQVRVSIQGVIDDASWHAIGEILRKSESGP